MRRRARSTVVVATAGLALLFGSGCGGRDRALGGGPEVDVCGAYDAYDELPEPDPSDQGEVTEWASGFLRVMERTEIKLRVTDRDGDRQDVPAAVAASIEELERSVEAYRNRLSKVGSSEAVARPVVDSLASDTRFVAADRRLREFRVEKCK